MSKKKTQTSGKLEKKESICMKTRRYELTGKEWNLLRPLIPISHTGRPQKNIARISTALCGAPARARWNVFLARFVPHQTVHRCFGRCQDDGILKKIFGICTASSTGAELSMDSTSIKASVQAGRTMRKRVKARQQAASAKYAEFQTWQLTPLPEDRKQEFAHQ